MALSSRRDFIKGLGLLALAALPACRRAQRIARGMEDSREASPEGELRYFASCFPAASGAFPLLASCYDCLPCALEPHPHALRRGLPALVQASLLSLFDARRPDAPSFNGAPFSWAAIRGVLRAWAGLLKEGRRFGLLLPEGFSPLRESQLARMSEWGGLRCYRFDSLALPRAETFAALEAQIADSVGAAGHFEHELHHGGLEELTRDLDSLDVLIIACPADAAALNADFAIKLQHCKAETLRLELLPDSTSRLCHYTLPLTHFLEEWGIEAGREGELCLRQPVTLPLREAASEAEIWEALLHPRGELVRAADTQEGVSPIRAQVLDFLPQGEHDFKSGVILHAAPRPRLLSKLQAGEGTHYYISPQFWDARLGENAWLREAYDPLSAYAGVPALYLPGEDSGDTPLIARLHLGSKSMELPACRRPDVPRVLLPLMPETVGFHAARVEVREGVLAHAPHQKVRSLPRALLAEKKALESVQSPVPQWALLVKVELCTGCNACTLACRAENNVPIVGAAEQQRGRDIQWLRLQRFCHEGQELIVPLSCRHCEQAPCEAVCPVNATQHSDSGLSTMVYARCWGTRYCAANCPYEARKFNFFDYSRIQQELTQLPPSQPQVALRGRGVMEKCSLCAQRLSEFELKNGAELPQTACQAACPRGAIELVDLRREQSAHQYGIYTGLDAAHTRPRVRYVLGK